jgi:membrane protein implicated in regulation of membrane protease activity
MTTNWIVLGALLIILELVVPGAVLVFLGIGALLVALLTWLGLLQTWVASITAWFVISLALLLVLRGFFQRFISGDEEKHNTDEDADAYGSIVEIVETITPENEGRIRYRGTTWQAACYDHTLEVGEWAQIIFRENLLWIVDPANPLDTDTLDEGDNPC